MNKKEWRNNMIEKFGITDEVCLEERPDFLEKTEYGKRCIVDELIGRALLKEVGYYETTFKTQPTYVTDLTLQYAGIDDIINLGNRSILIDEKACFGNGHYNDSITLEIMQLDQYGRWHPTQKEKMTNEFIYINACVDTMKLRVVRLSYPKMFLRANKYLSIMPEAVKELAPNKTDGVFHITGSGEGIYVLVPFSEAESVFEYNLLNNK